MSLAKQLGRLVIVSNRLEQNINSIIGKYDDENDVEGDSLGRKIHYLKANNEMQDFIRINSEFIKRLFAWNKERTKYIHDLVSQQDLHSDESLTKKIRIVVVEGETLISELASINDKLHVSSNEYMTAISYGTKYLEVE